jgi:hypothetical protein
MALGSTQPLTEVNTRNLPGGKGRPARKTDNLTAICVEEMWEPRRHTTLWAFTACYRDSFTFLPFIFLGLFDPEDGGGVFLRNVGLLSTRYTALYFER